MKMITTAEFRADLQALLLHDKQDLMTAMGHMLGTLSSRNPDMYRTVVALLTEGMPVVDSDPLSLGSIAKVGDCETCNGYGVLPHDREHATVCPVCQGSGKR